MLTSEHAEHNLFHAYKEPYDRLRRKVHSSKPSSDMEEDFKEIQRPTAAGFNATTIDDAGAVVEYFDRKGIVDRVCIIGKYTNP